jgi:hypothetical protein
MYKLLIGPALMGAAYAAGSVYGARSEQLVHKNPDATRAAVEQALGGVRPSGTTFFEGGTPMPYELKVDQIADDRLMISLYFAGHEGAQSELDFVPQNDGKDTLLVAKIHSDHSVLRTALAGTDKARLAYAPDWMLNLAVRPLLQQLGTQIEQGAPADLGWTQQEDEAQWQANLSADQREMVSQAQQYQATRPGIDPTADAEQHMTGGNDGR